MRLSLASLILGGLALTVAACERAEEEPKGVPVRVNGTVAAVVNNEPILASEVELEAAAQGLIPEGEALDVDNPDFERILNQLIDQKLLAQEAETRGLDDDPNTIRRLESFRERILGNILVESLVAEEVNEAAILEMYEAQMSLLELGEEVLIRHILVESRSTANDLYEQLRQGAEFAELAFAYSADNGSRAEGGLLGYVLPEEYPDFKDAINRTAVGAISRPFQTELGWHIIKVDDRRAERPPSFDEMRGTIASFLIKSEVSKILESLWTRAEIQTITGGDPMELFEIDAEEAFDDEPGAIEDEAVENGDTSEDAIESSDGDDEVQSPADSSTSDEETQE